MRPTRPEHALLLGDGWWLVVLVESGSTAAAEKTMVTIDERGVMGDGSEADERA
jgi:hypothetical protein